MLAQGINPKLLPETPDANFLTNDSLDSILDATNLTNTYLEEGDKKLKFQQAQRQTAMANTAQELQAAPVDPTTGAPNLASVAAVEKKYGVIIPDKTPAGIQRFIQSIDIPLEKQPEYEIKRKQADIYANMKPEALDDVVDNAIPLNQSTNKDINALAASLNSQTKALLHNPLITPDAYKSIIEKAASQLTEKQGSVAVANAEIPGKAALAGMTAAAAAAATDPYKAVEQARPGVEKAIADREQAYATTDLLGKLVASVKQGDKIAPGDVQTAAAQALGAFQNIRRTNQSQIEHIPGSTLDKVQTWLTNAAKGTGRLTPEELDEVVGVQNKIAQASEAKVQGYVKGVNSVLPPNAKSFNVPVHDSNASVPAPVKTVLANQTPGIHKLSDGTKWLKNTDGTIVGPLK